MPCKVSFVTFLSAIIWGNRVSHLLISAVSKFRRPHSPIVLKFLLTTNGTHFSQTVCNTQPQCTDLFIDVKTTHERFLISDILSIFTQAKRQFLSSVGRGTKN